MIHDLITLRTHNETNTQLAKKEATIFKAPLKHNSLRSLAILHGRLRQLTTTPRLTTGEGRQTTLDKGE